MRMPGYYFAASNRPLPDIASEAVRRQYGLGLAALVPRSAMGGHDPKPFVQAAIRAEERNKLYAEEGKGVEFLSGTLFRARVPLPASAPRGDYTADVYLLRGGHVIDRPLNPGSPSTRRGRSGASTISRATTRWPTGFRPC